MKLTGIAPVIGAVPESLIAFAALLLELERPEMVSLNHSNAVIPLRLVGLKNIPDCAIVLTPLEQVGGVAVNL
jgi:hypothetical protein